MKKSLTKLIVMMLIVTFLVSSFACAPNNGNDMEEVTYNNVDEFVSDFCDEDDAVSVSEDLIASSILNFEEETAATTRDGETAYDVTVNDDGSYKIIISGDNPTTIIANISVQLRRHTVMVE